MKEATAVVGTGFPPVSQALDGLETRPTEVLPLARSRAADYLALTKPRVAALVLFTVAAGAWCASRGEPDVAALVHALVGTALVAAGASALNQLLERHSDALMRRTENRPLPAGRLQPLEVLLFGLGLGGAGLVYLALLVQPLAVLVAGVTFASYVLVYTPLKRMTTLNTLVGAVPGALPPVIGWAAMRGTLGPEVLALFLILFVWQVPHFLAIAWIYRDDYARAGLRMLPVLDRRGRATGVQMVSYCLVLIPVSLAPVLLHRAGVLYLIGAVLLGCYFGGSALAFLRTRSVTQARRVLRASLVYLPALLALLLLEGLTRPAATDLWP
jgi:protoheme IX farnesyltransferase